MKNLVLAVALWFAAAGVAGKVMAADKAMEEKKAAPAATKAVAKDAAAPKAGALMVNINTATKDQLKMLKGIGDTRAQDIIDYRKKNGDFKSVDDLEKVKGVGPGTMKQIRANISVTGDTVVPKKAEPAAKAKDDKAKDTKAATKAMEDTKAKK